METNNLENIDDILERAYRYRRESLYKKNCYYEMSNNAQSNNLILGFFVTILSTVAGTAFIASLKGKSDSDNWMNFGIGLFTVATAVCSALQTFFGFAGKAEKSKKAAFLYESLYNKIDFIFLNYKLFKGVLEIGVKRDEIILKLRELITEFEKASEISPNIPRVIEKNNKVYLER